MITLIKILLLCLPILSYSQSIKKVSGVTDTNVKKAGGVSDTAIKKINGATFDAFTGLLDTYTGAGAAYSVRKLDKDYAGNCMRIERASDNTQTNIGFEADGDLDVSAIATFCSGTDGYVVTWYDQSGNAYDLINAALDWLIYTGGATNLKNGKPSIANVGSSDLETSVEITDLVGTNAFYTIITGTYADNATNGTSYISSSGSTIYATGHLFAVAVPEEVFGNLGFTTYSVGVSAINEGDQEIIEYLKVSASQDDVYRDGTQIDSGNTGSSSFTPSAGTETFQVGGNAFSLPCAEIQEVIVYPTNQSSNRSGIYTNVAAYF